MAKKNVINRDNPALSFMSVKADDEPQPAEAPATANGTPSESEETAPEGYYLNPKYIEKKQRYNICFKPSFKAKLDERAKKLGLSLSAYLEKIATEDMNKDEI